MRPSVRGMPPIISQTYHGLHGKNLCLLRYPAEQFFQERPEFGHRRDMATLIRRMRRTERRTETYQIHIRIYLPDKTALQTGMYYLHQCLFAEHFLIDFHHLCRNLRIEIRPLNSTFIPAMLKQLSNMVPI